MRPAPSSPVHWRALHADPNAPVVRAHLRAELRRRWAGRVADTDAFLRDFVRGRTVLDVGPVQHDLQRAELPTWKHRRIREVAHRVVGVDILPREVAALRERGFDIRLVDATSDEDLGERFERVVLGDVLEHVNEPVRLLRFAARHLAPSGRVLCSTPNPFFVAYLVSSLREGTYIPNAEHVAWITPTMALELGHRAGLDLVEYWHSQGEGKTPLRRLAVWMLTLARLRDSELFSGNFQYVFASAGEGPGVEH